MVSSLRNILTGKGVGTQEGILNKFGNMGTKLDEKLFGSKGMWTGGGHPTEQIWRPGKKGLLMNLEGGALDKGSGGIGEVFETLTEARGGGLKGKAEVIGAVLTASSTYAEALELANQIGVGDAMPGTEAEYMAWKKRIDEGTENFWEGTQAENYRTGGRVGYALGMGPAGRMMRQPQAPFEMTEEEEVVEMPTMQAGPDMRDPYFVDQRGRGGIGTLGPDYMQAESEGIYDEGEGGDWFNEMFLERTGGGGKDYMFSDEAKERDFNEIMTIGPRDDLKAKKIVLESGFDEMPYSVARFYKTNYEKYGRSPAIEVFATLPLINRMEVSRIRGAERVSNPPWLAPNDGSVRRISNDQGSIIYYNAGNPLSKPEQLRPMDNVVVNDQMIQKKEEEVLDAFYVPLFNPLMNKQNMTAFESQERLNISLQFLTPAVNRVNKYFVTLDIKLDGFIDISLLILISCLCF